MKFSFIKRKGEEPWKKVRPKKDDGMGIEGEQSFSLVLMIFFWILWNFVGKKKPPFYVFLLTSRENGCHENWLVKTGKAVGLIPMENDWILVCLEKIGEEKKRKKTPVVERRKPYRIRIRYPGRAISGQWNLKFIREVGKTDLKLWEKDWLRNWGVYWKQGIREKESCYFFGTRLFFLILFA